MTDLVRIPFRDGEILTVEIDGKAHIVLRPALDPFGIDSEAQIRKVQRQPWATTVVTTVVAADGKSRPMVAADVRTFLMLLATIPIARVSEAARPLLVAYQREVTEVIEAYWTKGGAINPRATARQLEDITRLAESQTRVLANLAGIVDPNWLEAKARHVAARALGEEPEIDPATRPLTVGEYLTDHGVGAEGQRALSSTFGKKLKAAFRVRYNRDPGVSERFVDGALRPVAAYTEADRVLFDQVWSVMRAQLGVAS